MFDTREQVLNQLRAGEDGRAEFKEVRLRDRGVISPDTEDAAGGLAALANAAGGVLFLGIDDSGAVRGIPPEHVDTVENWIVNVATHNCEPPIRPILRKVLLPGPAGDEQRVLLAEVPRGLYVHRTSGGRYYMRLGSTKRDLTPPGLVRLFQQRGREYVFDEQPVLAASVDALNRNRLEAFFGRSPTIPWLDLLRNTRVTFRDEDGVDRPTVAGLLVFGTEPTEFLASGSIEAACYRGTRLSSDDLIHAEQLAGPVSDQIDAGIAFVARFMQVPSDKRPSNDDDVPHDLDMLTKPSSTPSPTATTPSPARRSACSCSPTAWSSTAPASCPTPSTSTTCPTAPSPNQLLAIFLSRIRSKRTGQVFLESRGEGVRKILQDGEAHSGRRPMYELFGEELRLTLWAKMW